MGRHSDSTEDDNLRHLQHWQVKKNFPFESHFEPLVLFAENGVLLSQIQSGHNDLSGVTMTSEQKKPHEFFLSRLDLHEAAPLPLVSRGHTGCSPYNAACRDSADVHPIHSTGALRQWCRASVVAVQGRIPLPAVGRLRRNRCTLW